MDIATIHQLADQPITDDQAVLISDQINDLALDQTHLFRIHVEADLPAGIEWMAGLWYTEHRDGLAGIPAVFTYSA